MPERFAAEALGHNSKAIHRAYAKAAQVKVSALEEYEKLQVEGKLLKFASAKLEIPEFGNEGTEVNTPAKVG